ncbi:MAG: MogA/MoaB family molybdenum cofactor biosynthesis protein [Candidatus Methanofastidiosa archaeon]|nr:MogA/MoaB family molybdenum cofactor biosynthesis protein [Candidatus Methanofastidiosa archaeon]
MSASSHRQHAPKAFSFFVITISDSCSRQEREDLSGPHIIAALEGEHTFVGCTTVPDDKAEIEQAVLSAVLSADCVITTGGTGITRRDVTIPSVRPLLDREIVGFGELFRRLSYDEVGPAALISGALAGVIDETLVFCLPGSLGAVRLGTELIRLEAGHLLRHARE